MSFPQFDGAAEKAGRKRRRKRMTPLLSEEEVNVLKRKLTTSVKPPVSKKTPFQSDLDNVTNIVADFSKRPFKWVELPEGFDKRQLTEQVKEEVMDEKQAETNEALNLLLKQLDDMEEQKTKETQTHTDEVVWPYTNKPITCPIHLKPVKKHVSKKGWEYHKCNDSRSMLFCAKEDLEKYLKIANEQLYAVYRYKDDWPKCFCCH